MTDRMGWGILGTGGIARAFTSDLLLAGHKVTAVGSRTNESANRFASGFGIANAHGSYEALAADPSVDIIYIATPHPMHAANAKTALLAGKHVLVEKPFTLNAEEAQEVVDLAADKRLVALEAMWTRFLPHMIRIRQIVASGVMGEIRSVSAFHVQDLSDDPANRINAPELGGGALLDLGIYPISFAWDILGAPKTIQAIARFKDTGVDSQVATIFGYADGAIATTLSASDSGGSNTACILGTDGRIEIDHTWYRPTTVRVYDSGNRVTETFTTAVPGNGQQFQALEIERLVGASLIAGEILPPAETVAIMQTLDTIRTQIGLKYPNQ